VQTAVFYWRHHGINEDEFMTYDDSVEEVAVPAEAQAAVQHKKE
jgi:hypothetical protein